MLLETNLQQEKAGETGVISVILSTSNRAHLISRTLESFVALEPPPDPWELLIVDNGSTDETRKVLEQYQNNLPLTVFSEPVKGKNRALNKALEYARGDLFVFTDDDVLPSTDWLFQLYQAAQRHPDCFMFGGAIDLEWPLPPPKWIIQHVNLGVAYAKTPDDIPEKTVEGGKFIWGPNMMLRSEIFNKYDYRFFDAVGPRDDQKKYVMGSEAELTTRLARAGFKGVHIPSARVRHIVRMEQLDRRWLLQRARRFGKFVAFYEREFGDKQVKTIFGVPRWILRGLAGESVKALIAGSPFRTNVSFPSLWRLNILLGRLEGWR